MCDELRFSASQYLSLSISFPRSIYYPLIVVYFDGSGLVPKVDRRQRNSSLYTISMKVDAVLSFAWIQR